MLSVKTKKKDKTQHNLERTEIGLIKWDKQKKQKQVEIKANIPPQEKKGIKVIYMINLISFVDKS